MGNGQSAPPPACPCFSLEDTSGNTLIFHNPLYDDYGDEEVTSHILHLKDGRDFWAEEIYNYADGSQYLDCSSPEGHILEIRQEDYEECVANLQYTTPTTQEQLESLEQDVAGRLVTLQNQEDRRYLAVQGNTVAAQVQPGTETQWTFRTVTCPDHIENSATNRHDRACFSLTNVSSEIVLGTNGGSAFAHAQVDILGMYVLEPTLCLREDFGSCTVRLQLAFYGDKFIGDWEDGTGNFHVTDGPDGARTEWKINVLN